MKGVRFMSMSLCERREGKGGSIYSGVGSSVKVDFSGAASGADDDMVVMVNMAVGGGEEEGIGGRFVSV